LKALEKIRYTDDVATYNLGTGRGYSVLEMIKAFTGAAGRPIPYDIVDRRPGDITVCYADAGLAATGLNWIATRGLAAMCADTWRWQSHNPKGYPDNNPEDAL
jgi:UDP-glucose 4-epimerase